MLVLKQLVIFALVITLAYAKKGKGGDGNDEWDHLIHFNDANEGPQDQATQYVPEQPGIEFFIKLYYRLDISLFKKGKYDFIDDLIHYNDANEGPQDQATQYVPGQPGIELFVE